MTNKIRFIGAAASIALLTAGLTACDEGGRVRPPRTGVRVVHAAPTTGPIELYRVQVRATEPLDYRGASSLVAFDEDEYTFSARVETPGTGELVVVASFTQTVSAENSHLFVLTEEAGSVTPIIIANPLFESSTETEVSAVHAAPALASMSVYVEPPDADLTTATPLGSVGFKAALAPATRAPGDYRLTLTAPGNPANVLFSSATMELGAGDSNSFVIVDDAGDGVAPFSVVRAGGASALLIDRNVRSGVELVNAAADQGARDLFVDGDYTAPLVSALAYATISDIETVAPGNRELSVTPAGNPGVVEYEQEIAAVRGRRSTALFAGEPGDVSIAVAQDDNRRVTTPSQGRVRFMNGASQHDPLEFFLVTPGTDLTNRSSQISLAAPAISARASVPPNDYELVLRDADTDAIVYGPQPMTIGNGIYTILAINGATAGTVDVVLLEDFN
jgi:hypothetical protein